MSELEPILKLILAGMMGIIGYFLRDTAASLKDVRKMSEAHDVKLAVHDQRLTQLEKEVA